VGVGIWVAVVSKGVDDIVTCGVEGVGVGVDKDELEEVSPGHDELEEVSPGHVSSPTPFLHISSTAKPNI